MPLYCIPEHYLRPGGEICMPAAGRSGLRQHVAGHGIRFFKIGDHNVSCVAAVYGHMDYSPQAVAISMGDIHLFHQFGIAVAEKVAADLGVDEVHSELLPGDKVVQVDLSISLPYARCRLLLMGWEEEHSASAAYSSSWSSSISL